MLGGDAIGVGDHGDFAVADRDLAVIAPGDARDIGRRQRFELPLDFGQSCGGKRGRSRDQSDAGAHIVFGLRQKIRGDHFGIAGLVGNDVDFRRSGELVDADAAEHLAFGFVHIGVARSHDLVHRRHAFGAIGHGRDGLGAANAENPIRTREMTARDHGRMGIGRQAGDHLVDARHLGRNDGHDGRRQQRITPARHIAADLGDRDDAVPQMHAGQALDLQRQDGGELRLGKARHVGDGEFGVGAGLRVELGEGVLTLARRHLELFDVYLVESQRVVAYRSIAPLSHIADNCPDQCFDGRVVALSVARRRLELTHALGQRVTLI